MNAFEKPLRYFVDLVRLSAKGRYQVQLHSLVVGRLRTALRIGNDAARDYKNLLQAFCNPRLRINKAVQAGDAGVALPESTTNTNSCANYLDGQGNTLSSAQKSLTATHIASADGTRLKSPTIFNSHQPFQQPHARSAV